MAGSDGKARGELGRFNSYSVQSTHGFDLMELLLMSFSLVLRNRTIKYQAYVDQSLCTCILTLRLIVGLPLASMSSSSINCSCYGQVLLCTPYVQLLRSTTTTRACPQFYSIWKTEMLTTLVETVVQVSLLQISKHYPFNGTAWSCDPPFPT